MVETIVFVGAFSQKSTKINFSIRFLQKGKICYHFCDQILMAQRFSRNISFPENFGENMCKTGASARGS
jgi:hypothetical protein